MNPAETSIEKARAAGAKRRSPALRVFCLLSLLLLFVLLAGVFTPNNASRQLVWLTPAQSAEAMKPGPLAKLRQTVTTRLAPWLGRFYKKRPNIEAASTIYAISPGTTLPSMRGPPVATNAEGMNAWVLAPVELASLRGGINTNPGVLREFAPRVIVGNGMQAQVLVGNSFPLTTSNWTNVGIVINLVPRITADSVKLVLAASSTALAGLDSDQGPKIETNFFVACRALIPDYGGLVILCHNASRGNPTNYLLVISPRLVDAKGNPVKH